MKYTYFEEATQVVYWESVGEQWFAGIAYKDFVICGCCGSVIEIKEIYDCAPGHIENPIQRFSNWVDITEVIAGDVMSAFNE